MPSGNDTDGCLFSVLPPMLSPVTTCMCLPVCILHMESLPNDHIEPYKRNWFPVALLPAAVFSTRPLYHAFWPILGRSCLLCFFGVLSAIAWLHMLGLNGLENEFVAPPPSAYGSFVFDLLRVLLGIKCPKLSGSCFFWTHFKKTEALCYVTLSFFGLHYKWTAKKEKVFQVSLISRRSVSLVYLTTLSDVYDHEQNRMRWWLWTLWIEEVVCFNSLQQNSSELQKKIMRTSVVLAGLRTENWTRDAVSGS